MVDIFVESFETDGNGTRYTTSVAEFTDGSGDFFTRTDGSNIDGSYEVTAADGGFYFAAMDTNGETGGADVVTVTWNTLDIAGFSNLNFSSLFAEDDSSDGDEDWDADALVFFEYSIDGAAFNKVIQFASGGETNTEPGLDTDFDEVRDGNALTNTFTEFSSVIPETGSNLDLRLTIENLEAGDEDIAIDNIKITGDNDDGSERVALDLSNYVRIGRYNLPEPSRTTAPTGSELALEVSTITYNSDTDTLFVLGDEGTSIVQVDKTGQLIDSMTLTDGDFDDPEGLTYVSNGQFVLVEERERQASLFTYTPGGILSQGEVQTVDLGTNIGNIGLEGVSNDPQSGGFIFVKEKEPQGIFQTEIDFDAGTATNGSETTENSTNLFDPTLLGLDDIGDVFALSGASFLAGQEAASNLLVLSQESGKIVEVDRSGIILSELEIESDAGNPLSVENQGFEGLTLDNDGLLYLASENGGGDNNHPQVWVYAPDSFTFPNAAPVAVSVANAVTSLLENSDTSSAIKLGNIIVSDDVLGTNILSVSGTHADDFEIVDNELFLKAETNLDFDTQPSYEVTIEVDDATLENTPDATTSFTLDLIDTAEATSLIVSEVAPWSSGNSSLNADWFEVTNTGDTPIDITDWRMDDDSASFANGAVISTEVTVIQPGQSVIFVDGDAATITAFKSIWFGSSAPDDFAIGSYDGPGLSTSGDAVSLFNASGELVTGVSFGASPSGSPFATFDNATGQPIVSNLSTAGINGAFSVIDAGEAAVLVGSPGTIDGTSATTTTVGIVATGATATENGPTPGELTILRTGDTTGDLTVTYSISGDADNGTDYTAIETNTVTFPAGTSQVAIGINPVDDGEQEDTESVTLTLTDGIDYDIQSNAESATVTIEDNDSVIPDFNLQITEIWPGNGEGDDLTEDWFEITNLGSEAWESGVAPELYYDDESQAPEDATVINGLTQLNPGETAIVVVGEAGDANTFRTVWESVIDLNNVEIGYTDGSGLGGGGDAVSLFVGLPSAEATPVDVEAYPDTDAYPGQSYDVTLSAFSIAGENGAVATDVNDANEAAIASPGTLPPSNDNDDEVLVFGSLNDDSFDGEIGETQFNAVNDLLFTGAGEDTVDATTGSGNRIYAGSETDELFAGTNDRFFAGAGDDILDATLSQGGNRLYGGAGNDDFFGGWNNDRLLGGKGFDRFFLAEESGESIITGGADSDQFWLANAGFPVATNTITDFTSGEDILGVAGIGVGDIEDLSISQSGDDTTIGFNGNPLAILLNVDSNSLTNNDFSFVNEVVA